MSRKPPEPVQVIKQRRDAALGALVDGIPYIRHLGIRFERRGDELTSVLPFADHIVGNPTLPAIHGGVTAAFLETAALIELAWSRLWEEIERERVEPGDLTRENLPRMPKTIDITLDYLRPGLPRDAYARARIVRSGRRYASVQAEGWQDNRGRPFASAVCHFLMPPARDG